MARRIPRSLVATWSGVVFALLVALTVAPTRLDAQKGKPTVPPNVEGSVTFADEQGYHLTSDGLGPYADATIYGSGTLYLDLAAAGRTMQITLDATTVGATAPSNHVEPDTYVTNAVFRIDNIDHAPIGGGWVRSVGRIGFGTGLPNHALGFRYATANGVPIYGTEVCVRRVDDVSPATPATWRIASSDACSGDGGNAGLFEEGLKGKGYRWEAVYTVRFEATVVCTSGSTCPQ